jgi:diguanylate cyclase (GGDEF)-like protein
MTKRRHVERAPAATIKFSSQTVADYQAGIKRYASVLVVGGSEADLGQHVVLDREVLVGRAPESELPLHDTGISRRHARIFHEEEHGRYVIEDLGSTNGTRLCGVPLTTPTPLVEGDKIVLGSTVLKFSYSDEVEVGFHQTVQRLVATDSLTGLEVKRRFDALLGMALQAAEAGEQPLAVLMMDMDGLKPINDTHGHHMGGYAIAQVAKLIEEELGEEGRSCRYGGDEFMAFLPATDRSAAQRVAERIRQRVEKHHFEQDGIVVSPTLSIGVAAFPDDGVGADELGRRADEALYRAKGQGKNRVSV